MESVEFNVVMKKILATITVAVLAISTSFAQCGGGGCEGKKDDKKKEGTKETATMSVKL